MKTPLGIIIVTLFQIFDGTIYLLAGLSLIANKFLEIVLYKHWINSYPSLLNQKFLFFMGLFLVFLFIIRFYIGIELLKSNKKVWILAIVMSSIEILIVFMAYLPQKMIYESIFHLIVQTTIILLLTNKKSLKFINKNHQQP